MSKVSDIGEFGLIKRLSRKIKTDKSVVRGIGDDAAVMEYNKDKYLLFTADMLIEGRHFLKGENPRQIGHKALACSISDIVAMGGLPKYAVVSLGLPKNTTLKCIDGIYRGITNLAKKFRVNIVGGDTNASDKLIIDVALLGEVKKKALALRSGAKRGDLLFVTGGLGNSLKSGHHLDFTPRAKESQYLVKNFLPSAMIDISDGLVADLGHILEKSRKGAILYEELIPKNKDALLSGALYSGEDFELLFTLPLKEGRRLLKVKKPKGMRFFLIGEITAYPGITLVDKRSQCREIKIKGFKHF